MLSGQETLTDVIADDGGGGVTPVLELELPSPQPASKSSAQMAREEPKRDGIDRTASGVRIMRTPGQT